MTRRARKPQRKLEFTPWVLEVETHEVVYGLIALPPGSLRLARHSMTTRND